MNRITFIGANSNLLWYTMNISNSGSSFGNMFWNKTGDLMYKRDTITDLEVRLLYDQ